MYSAIFSLSSLSELLGDINSATKSEHRGPNLSSSSSVKTSRRSRRTHEASGPRIAEFGNLKPAEESNGIPRPSFLDQLVSSAERMALRQLLFNPDGGMMISCFRAVSSMRRSLLSRQS